MRSLTLVILAAFGAGCAPAQPPRWAEGGAPLALAAAHWEREGGADVELRADGRVLVDGDLVFVIDRVGRVTDDDYDPFAVLLPDGQLVGAGNVSLGRLGVTNASPPGALEAWLAVLPDGKVVYFNPDGERISGGVWHERRTYPLQPRQTPPELRCPSESKYTTWPSGITASHASKPPGGDAFVTPSRPSEVSSVPTSCPSGSSTANGS